MNRPEFEVELRSVAKRYGEVAAVRGVSLEIRPGEMFSILGPSGCGKTTTLRMVAGFVQPSEGQVVIRNQVVTYVPSYKRNTAMVFQNYALFPHLTVFDNVAFGLKMRRAARSEIERRVQSALQMVHMDGHRQAYPRQLSGGQQQRVALARALVVSPDVLLLDEPLSNLDAKLRQEVRVEIRELVKRLGMTALYVTHDQEEALAISDRMAVMHSGTVEQVGTPQEIYDRPETLFVATFIGTANVLRGRLTERTADELCIETGTGLTIHAAHRDHEVPLFIAAILRPERIVLGAEARNLRNHVGGRIVKRVFVGENTHYHLDVGGDLTVRVHQQNRAGRSFEEGEHVALGWAAEDVRVVAAPAEVNHVGGSLS